ncbi:hypothetical protein RAS1_10810 [Phycisphaerae bacterium RAS1]|nr:hypothetical protein RAS1_10810 [Phycisphaerae bacterium RAS1]
MNKCFLTNTRNALLIAAWAAAAWTAAAQSATTLPFGVKIETYRSKEVGEIVFAVMLDQPFLAEEFEKSNFLRLTPLDPRAYLTYPKETRFEQKHATFYGRMRGEGVARVRVTYENVTENPDGSRRVSEQHGDLEISIPAEPGGPAAIFTEWARQQNLHFCHLLEAYPNDSFLQYALLQSKQRYGVTPPPLPSPASESKQVESSLYSFFSGSLAIQESLQRQSFGARGDAPQETHISSLTSPVVRTTDYAALLEKRKAAGGPPPERIELARAIPGDQYMLHVRSFDAARELFDLGDDWGGSLLRLMSVTARDDRLQDRFETQLIAPRSGVSQLFAENAVSEMALSGSDTALRDGSDLTIVFRVKRPDLFDAASATWLEAARAADPRIELREFNYRGKQIAARYTPDRRISSFVVRHDDLAVFSNSHVTIRRVVNTLLGSAGALYDEPDYAYVAGLLPPGEVAYFYASEAFLRRSISPQSKISEKRRRQCFNNLVMLNNASLLFRMENGRSPASLSELGAGRFIDAERLTCPHGGSYAFDADADTAACSLHNRLPLLTPNAELSVLKVSAVEREEYERYRDRCQAAWGDAFNPVAVRIRTQPSVRLEFCVLPMGPESLYEAFRSATDTRIAHAAPPPAASTTLLTLTAAPGRPRIGALLRDLPGIADVLAADPTLTDLNWIGDNVSVHLCDNDTIVEVDPTCLRTLSFFREIDVFDQSLAAGVVLATSLPAYATIELADADKAQRFLELLSSRLFLEHKSVYGFETRFDAYRLPDYQGFANYVVSYQFYALKLRLHVALTGDRLVAATTPKALRDVIDAVAARETAGQAAPPGGEAAHIRADISLAAMSAFKESLRLYWAEKSRLACHANITPVRHLAALYGAPLDQIDRLSQSKYGVTFFCPEGGRYEYDQARDQVTCSVHGNRQDSRQPQVIDRDSSFFRFVDSIDRISATIAFREDHALATLDIRRR